MVNFPVYLKDFVELKKTIIFRRNLVAALGMRSDQFRSRSLISFAVGASLVVQ